MQQISSRLLAAAPFHYSIQQNFLSYFLFDTNRNLAWLALQARSRATPTEFSKRLCFLSADYDLLFIFSTS